MQEMLVQSIGWEDPLEKEMATHSSFPAWEIAWTEEPGKLQSMGLQRHGHDLVPNHHHHHIQMYVCVCVYVHVCVCVYFLCKYSGALTGVHSIDKPIFTSLFDPNRGAAPLSILVALLFN